MILSEKLCKMRMLDPTGVKSLNSRELNNWNRIIWRYFLMRMECGDCGWVVHEVD
jgi:hypothetical protein